MIMGEVPVDTDAVGIQLRYIQSDHGGGECNCWSLSYLNLQYSPDDGGDRQDLVDFSSGPGRVFTDESACHTQSQESGNFCYGSALSARGLVTKAYYFKESSVEVECPGRSATSLYPNLIFSIPEGCSSIVPRM